MFLHRRQINDLSLGPVGHKCFSMKRSYQQRRTSAKWLSKPHELLEVKWLVLETNATHRLVNVENFGDWWLIPVGWVGDWKSIDCHSTLCHSTTC